MTKHKFTIAASALTPRIYCGRVNKVGDAFLTGKVDVTSDVLKAVVDYIGVSNEAQVKVDGVTKYIVRVAEA